MHLEPLNGAPPAARRQRTASTVLGIVLAVIFVLGGLALVGVILVYIVALAHFGSNK